VRNLTVLSLIALLVTSSSVSATKQRKATHKSGHGSATMVTPYLAPEAIRMR
jgi:hypothetical protein